MKKKRLAALLLSAVMLLSLVGCNTQTRSEVEGDTGGSSGESVSLNLLYQSSDEVVANVIRDELTRAGFTVEMSAASDGATFREQQSNGNFDISIFSWANIMGNPDYSVRGVWHSTGASNYAGINDPTVDSLIEEAAAQTAEEYVATYGELEKYVVEEQTYMTPLYQKITGRGFSKVLDASTVTNNQRWENLSYADPSQNATRPLILAQNAGTLTTWDPIRANDQTSGYALDHMYIHLLTLQPDWSVSTDESLSYSYAVSEDNTQYYFLLRDDCNFARIDENGEVYDSGVMVSGEDVVYSLERARDPNSTPLHQTYSVYENLSSTEVVTDISVLDNTMTASGQSVREVLEAEGQTIGSLVATRDEVDNAAGNYQVVCCTTSIPYPQILNGLTFHGAGIVDSEWVEAMNADVDIANYDATSDQLYGDAVTTMEGAGYANHLSLSGNYVLTSMNDYQMNFVANPYIRTNDTERGEPIAAITDRLMSDSEACLSALRSGEVDYPYNLPETKYETVEQDENLSMTTFAGTRVYMLAFNMHGGSVVSDSADLRKAIASCIKYEDINAVLAGNTVQCTSFLSACMDCGNSFSYAEGDTQKYLDAYFAGQA